MPPPHAALGRPRDFLGKFCFVLHVAVVVYILAGWALPVGLPFYLIFLPAMVLHWPLNRGACVLNSLETWLRQGRWRDPANPEEGGWVRCLVGDVAGIELSDRRMSGLIYALVMLVWGLGWWHFSGWALPLRHTP